MALQLGLDINIASVKMRVFDFVPRHFDFDRYSYRQPDYDESIRINMTGQSEGYCLYLGRFGYTGLTRVVGHVELNVKPYRSATCTVIPEALASDEVAQEIMETSVSTKDETVFPADLSGKPIHPAFVWLDNGNHGESQQVNEQLDCETYRHTSIPDTNPTWTACPLAHLHTNGSPKPWKRSVWNPNVCLIFSELDRWRVY